MSNSTFEDELNKKGVLVYTNVGDSMKPLIRQGRDVLIIRKPDAWAHLPAGSVTEKLRPYDIPLYKRDSGEYVLHRVLGVKKDGYVICGDNRYIREYGICDRHVLGVLTGIQRNGKEISLHSVKYKVYVFFRCRCFALRAGLLWCRDLPYRIWRKIKKIQNKTN